MSAPSASMEPVRRAEIVKVDASMPPPLASATPTTAFPSFQQPPQLAYGWFVPHPPPYGPYFWPCLPPGYALVPAKVSTVVAVAMRDGQPVEGSAVALSKRPHSDVGGTSSTEAPAAKVAKVAENTTAAVDATAAADSKDSGQKGGEESSRTPSLTRATASVTQSPSTYLTSPPAPAKVAVLQSTAGADQTQTQTNTRSKGATEAGADTATRTRKRTQDDGDTSSKK